MSAKRGMLLLEWSSEAEEDVASIIGYIYARNPEAARELLDLIDEKSPVCGLMQECIEKAGFPALERWS